jgi:hypothetical protein
LVAILKSKRIWASLATALTDRSEVAYGVDVAREVLGDSTVRASEPFRQMAARFLIPDASPQAIRVADSPYIASFCAHADRAVHWLHYGRSGTGVAIGLDARRIETKPFDLVRVVYDIADQKGLVRQLIETVFDRLLQEAPKVPQDERETLGRMAAHLTGNYLRFLSPRLKSAAFEAEDEWRLVTYDLTGDRVPEPEMPLTTFFRTVAGRVVPYMECAYDTLPATQLILGAAGALEPDDPGLAVLLREANLRDIRILKSFVPVRP